MRSVNQKIKLDAFRLKKVKIESNKVVIEFKDQEKDINNHIIVKSNQMPHDDLMEIMRKVKGVLIDMFNLRKGFDVGEKYLRGEKKNKLDEVLDTLRDKIKVNGVTLSGDNEDMVLLSGVMVSANDKLVALNTPLIDIDGEVLGYEESLREDIKRLKREVYSYVFEGKQAQLTMDFQDKVEA